MLHELIAESSDYEFREQLEIKKPKSWLKTISSFANTIGGTIFFGQIVNFIQISQKYPKSNTLTKESRSKY